MPETGKFAFIIHPLTLADISRKFPLLRILPQSASRLVLRLYGARKTSDITGVRSRTGQELEGMFIGCPLTSEMLLHGDIAANTRTIVECGRVAEAHGAKIVGLGAYTSVVGDAGVTIAKQLDIAVTTGNSYTVGTAIEGSLRACALLGKDRASLHAGVLGATGAIGKACSRILARDVERLVLIGRDTERLEAVAADLDGRAEVSISTDAPVVLPELDLVLTVTSALTTVVEPEDIKRGAVICDVARPRDVSREVADSRPDVLVIEGGVVSVPGDVEFGLDFGFPPKTAYACMAETMILALEGRYEDYSLGRDLSVEKVREITALAEKHGFELAGLRSFERAIDEAAIERVKALSGAR